MEASVCTWQLGDNRICMNLSFLNSYQYKVNHCGPRASRSILKQPHINKNIVQLVQSVFSLNIFFIIQSIRVKQSKSLKKYMCMYFKIHTHQLKSCQKEKKSTYLRSQYDRSEIAASLLSTSNSMCNLASLFFEFQELLQSFLMFWRYLHCTKEREREIRKTYFAELVPKCIKIHTKKLWWSGIFF